MATKSPFWGWRHSTQAGVRTACCRLGFDHQHPTGLLSTIRRNAWAQKGVTAEHHHIRPRLKNETKAINKFLFYWNSLGCSTMFCSSPYHRRGISTNRILAKAWAREIAQGDGSTILLGISPKCYWVWSQPRLPPIGHCIQMSQCRTAYGRVLNLSF